LQVVVFPYGGCSFTAVTWVQIPSGTPNLINGLEEIVLFSAGTKRHKSHPNSAGASPESPMFSRVSSLFLPVQKGTAQDRTFSRRFHLRESDGLHHFAPCACEA
jgi:hypothetical protein